MSIEMVEEQLEMESTPRLFKGTNLEQYETKVNATTHRPDDIFDYKDIWKGLELSHNSSLNPR